MSALVVRFNYSPDGQIRPPEYLCREEALFAEVEWMWLTSRDRAHAFPSHADAEVRATELTRETGRTCFATVIKREELWPLSPAGHRHLSPQEVFAENERRHLA